jgi:hypothetical protein
MVGIHPEFVVNDKNEKKAVVLPFSEWQLVMEELEELDDIRAYDKAKSHPSTPIPFDEAIQEIERGKQA